MGTSTIICNTSGSVMTCVTDDIVSYGDFIFVAMVIVFFISLLGVGLFFNPLKKI